MHRLSVMPLMPQDTGSGELAVRTAVTPTLITIARMAAMTRTSIAEKPHCPFMPVS